MFSNYSLLPELTFSLFWFLYDCLVIDVIETDLLKLSEIMHVELSFQEIVLRDNQLKKIPDVEIFKKLLVFDVSFNEISSLNGLSKVSSTLRELYVSKNEITKMEEIEHFHELQILELGSNRLRVSFS